MSYDEILQREINTSRKAIEKVLSREASALNYPLKINTVVEDNSIINCLNSLVDHTPSTLVLVNSEPDNYIFHSQKEIIKTFKNRNLQVIVVPSGKQFNEFNKVLMITNFNGDNAFDKYLKADSFLSGFKPIINAVDIAKPKKYLEKELKSKAWLQIAETESFQYTIKTNILTGHNYINVLQNYILNTEPDLILLSNKQPGLFGNRLTKNIEKDLIQNSEIPILF